MKRDITKEELELVYEAIGEAGGVAKLAEELCINRATIYDWIKEIRPPRIANLIMLKHFLRKKAKRDAAK